MGIHNDDWFRRKGERTDVYIRRVRALDVEKTLEEAMDHVHAGRPAHAMTSCLAAAHRIAYPNDPRVIRERRVTGVRDDVRSTIGDDDGGEEEDDVD